ncbi:MAG: hypothetical protein EBU90_04565 [Proteobacteria bacterium]|nr:hypothetical protein [Pseudomonadota bacterium]
MYSNSSPYNNTPIVNGYLDILNLPDLPRETDDILFEITKVYENRPDLLANDLYKDSNLWWVFAVRNKQVLKDPVFDFTAGTKIYLPKMSTIKKVREV